MPVIPLPPTEAVAGLLGELLTNPSEVEDVEQTLALRPDLTALIAEYVDAEGHVVGAAVADLGFAAHSGAALVMLPVETAAEAVVAGAIDDDLLDCFTEVANVLARLLNAGGARHSRMRGLFRSGQLIPGELRSVLTGGARREFHVAIDGYGAGRLLLATPDERAGAVAA